MRERPGREWPQAVDIEIQAREIIFHKNNLNHIMAEYTGQPFEKVSLPPPLGLGFVAPPRQPILLHADMRPVFA